MPKTKVWNISGLFLAIMAPRWEKQRRIPFMNGPLPIPLLIETRLVSAVAGLKSNQCHRVTCFHLDQKSVEFFVSICLYEWVTQVNFWSYPYRWFQLCLTFFVWSSLLTTQKHWICHLVHDISSKHMDEGQEIYANLL